MTDQITNTSTSRDTSGVFDDHAKVFFRSNNYPSNKASVVS